MTEVSHPSTWWKHVDEDTRTWLRENPGEGLPADIANEISSFDLSEVVFNAGVGDRADENVFISEDGWDWIKAHG